MKLLPTPRFLNVLYYFQCKGHLVPHLNPTSIACCSDENYCNQGLTPMYTATTDDLLDHLDDGEDEGGGAAAASGLGIFHSMDQSTGIALLVSLTVCLSKFGFL